MTPPNLKYIITGCPCSGTGYVAKTLHKRGVKAGHEVFDYQIAEDRWGSPVGNGYGTPASEIVVEVNHGLAGALEHIDPDSSIEVVHLVRNPLKTLNSWLSVGLRHPEPVSPGVMAEKLWKSNELVSRSPLLIYRHRVEDPIKELINVLGLAAEPSPHVPGSYNAHNQGRCNFSWEDLVDHPWCDKLREQYRAYGYDS